MGSPVSSATGLKDCSRWERDWRLVRRQAHKAETTAAVSMDPRTARPCEQRVRSRRLLSESVVKAMCRGVRALKRSKRGRFVPQSAARTGGDVLGSAGLPPRWCSRTLDRWGYGFFGFGGWDATVGDGRSGVGGSGGGVGGVGGHDLYRAEDEVRDEWACACDPESERRHLCGWHVHAGDGPLWNGAGALRPGRV